MKAIIFDLDYTIFDMKQYLFGAFEKISSYLSKKHYLSKERIYNKLIELLNEKTSNYLYLFNDLLEHFNLKENIKEIVNLFNNYEGDFTPYPNVIKILKVLKKRKFKLGIITDGNVDRQKRKINNLNISDFFDSIIYTKELNHPKPSLIPFIEIVKDLNINPEKSFYIADNPLVDFKGAKEAGFNTIRIKRGEFSHIPPNEDIDTEINSLNELLDINK